VVISDRVRSDQVTASGINPLSTGRSFQTGLRVTALDRTIGAGWARHAFVREPRASSGSCVPQVDHRARVPGVSGGTATCSIHDSARKRQSKMHLDQFGSSESFRPHGRRLESLGAILVVGILLGVGGS
jgi:hypothetical protein